MSLRSTRIVSSDPAGKIIEACRRSGAISLEVWLASARLRFDAPPARIVTLSLDEKRRNFTLGLGNRRGKGYYLTRLRTTATDDNGFPHPTSTFGAATTALSHLVFVRHATGANRFYVDGVERPGRLEVEHLVFDAWPGAIGGDFSNWSPDFHLALANEVAESRPWLGEYRHVAIFDRALAREEVRHRFRRGLQQ